MSFWSAVRESLRGSQQDYTTGSLSRGITLLAIPMILEMAMESLFGIVDIFFVSSLGTRSVAVVSLTESLLGIVFGIAMGLSMAATATVSRRIGEKDPEAAASAAFQGIVLGLVVSAAVGVIGFYFAADLLRLMGAEQAVIDHGQGFTRLILGGVVTVFMLFLNNAIFRGAGDAALAMRALWLANGVNIVLNPCLIRGIGPFPELGLLGSAVGTTIGRCTGVVFQFYLLFRGKSRVKPTAKHIRLDFPVMLRMLRISLTGMLQFLIATASWMGLVRIIANFGSAALAGYTIAIRVVIFTILPSWGLGNAATTLVGQNLGAKRPDRAERSVWLAGFYNMIFLGVLGLVFIFFPEPIVGIFSRDPGVLPVAADCLRYISYGYMFYAYGMVIVQAFNGAGDTNTPTLINFFCYWLFQIPVAWYLAMHTRLGTKGVFLAITMAESLIAVVGVLAFRRGRWKLQVV